MADKTSPNKTSPDKTSSDQAAGCLSALIGFALLATIFGGGIHFRIGGFQFGLGQPIHPEQINSEYLDNLAKRKESADEAVKAFHAQMNEGKCTDIYDQASEVFKQQLSREDLERRCTKQRSELGSVKSTQQIDWWERPVNSTDHHILIKNNTQFSNASIQEIFVWLVRDRKATLVAYQFRESNSGRSLF